MKAEIWALRLPSEIRTRGEVLAAIEHGTTSSVLRRAMLIGLRELETQAEKIAGGREQPREPVAS